MPRQSIRERIREIRRNRPCGECNHRSHGAGACESCNCGESGVLLPERVRDEESMGGDSDVETAAYMGGGDAGDPYEFTRVLY